MNAGKIEVDKEKLQLAIFIITFPRKIIYYVTKASLSVDVTQCVIITYGFEDVLTYNTILSDVAFSNSLIRII